MYRFIAVKLVKRKSLRSRFVDASMTTRAAAEERMGG
jgi:hypothetical protein